MLGGDRHFKKDNFTIKQTVDKLLKNNDELDDNLVNKVNNMFEDRETVDAVIDEFTQRKKNIDSIADKFVKLFYKKFDSGMTIHAITRKLIKYKAKYNLTDDVFQSAKRQFEKHIYKNSNDIEKKKYVNSNIGKSLGNPYIEINDGIKTQSTDDYQYI